MMHATTMNATIETTTSKAHIGKPENGVDNETFISVMIVVFDVEVEQFKRLEIEASL